MPFTFSFSSIQFANLIAGKRLSLTADKFTPLSPDKFWSAFDDYLTLQQALSGHPDVILETGDNQPANGVGATIRFEYENSITRETLIIYDPQKRIWKIKLPEANSIFSFYELTIRVYPISDVGEGSEVTLTLDFSVQGNNAEERAKNLQLLANLPEYQRVNEINNFILQRDGLRSSFEVDIYCPAEKLWAIIGTWEDVSWVQHSLDVRMLTGGGRRIIFPQNQILEENLIYADDAEKTLVYEVTKSIMPVILYQGTIKLYAIDSQSTNVQYNNVYLPKEGLEPQQVKAGMDRSFKERFDWLHKQFYFRSLSS